VRFLGDNAFHDCKSLACVHFDCHSSIWQLKSRTFSSCTSLTSITIPSSVKQIHDRAFNDCSRLGSVTCKLPSQCWHLASGLFVACDELPSLSLPPSVEVIDPTPHLYLLPFESSDIPYYSALHSSTFCVENDCFMGANGRQLIQYQGGSSTFCISEKISVLRGGLFTRGTSPKTIIFGSKSRIILFLDGCFSGCITRRSLEVPKSVHLICACCFEGCSQLTTVTFEPHATIGTLRIGHSQTVRFWSLSLFLLPFQKSLGKVRFRSARNYTILHSVPGHSCGAYARTHLQVFLDKQLSFQRLWRKPIPLLLDPFGGAHSNLMYRPLF
jgi:hypothetical protein